MYRTVADIKTAEQLQLNVPKLKTGKPIIIEAQISNETSDFMKNTLPARLDALKARQVDPREDNYLKCYNDGINAAVDSRLIDSSNPDDPDSKLNKCVDTVFEEWKAGKADKLTQLIFLDRGLGADGVSINLYDDIKKKLVKLGVPANEIAFIHDAANPKQQTELQAKVQNGDVRVLIGSTAKMGEGKNVQQRLVAIHELDIPKRPSDIEQRRGRIVRQGNMNTEVKIYSYITPETFDSYSFQMLQNKQHQFSTFLNNPEGNRTLSEEDDFALQLGEMKALATGNPDIMRYAEVEQELQKLTALEKGFRDEKYRNQDSILSNKKGIEYYTGLVEKLTKDLETYNKNKTNEFSMKVDKTILNKDQKEEAGQSILDTINNLQLSDKGKVIGEYSGFKLKLGVVKDHITNGYEKVLVIEGANSYEINLSDSAKGMIQRINNELNNIEKRKSIYEINISERQNEIKVLEKELQNEFKHKDKLESLQQEKTELLTRLQLDKKQDDVVAMEETDESDDAMIGEDILSYDAKNDITETKQFKKWFGDSKVTDDSGKPLVVYHGTNASKNFDTFKPSYAPGWGEGIYFSDNPNTLSEYFSGENGRIIPVYLNIQNPFTGKYPGDSAIEKTDTYKKIYEQEKEKAIRYGEYNPEYDDDFELDIYDIWNEDGDFANNVIRDLGYDGIISEGSNGIKGKEIVVFNPNQIKSATGNSGEFDANNPSILRDNKFNYQGKGAEQIAKEAITATENLENSIRRTSRNFNGNGIKTTGLSFTQEIKKKGYVDLKGRIVENTKDLAVIAQIFRDPRYETFRIVYTKGNEILAHEAMTSRIPGSTIAFLKDQESSFKDMNDRMSRLGADGYYLIHNHPSGEPNASKGDIAATNQYIKNIEGFKGHIIINSNKYGLIENTYNNITETVYDLDLGEDKILTPSIDNPLLGQQINSANKLAKAAKRLQLSENQSSLFFMDAKLKVRAIQEIPNGLMNNEKAIVDYLRGRMREFGSTNVFLNATNENLTPTLVNLIKNGYITDATMTIDDVTVSLREDMGIYPRSKQGQWMGISEHKGIRVNEEGSTYEYRRFITNSVFNAEAVPQEIKKALQDNPELYEYTKQPDIASENYAKDFVDKDFNEAVRTINKLESLKDSKDTAVAIEIFKRYIQEGNHDAAEAWSLKIAKFGTGLGQAIQYFSMLQRYTPEWTLNNVQRRLNKIAGKENLNRLDSISNELANKLNEVNKETIDSLWDILNNKDGDFLNKLKESFQNIDEKSKKKEKLTPQEILARKVVAQIMESDGEAEVDPLKTMVDTLYKVALENLPSKEKPAEIHPVHFVVEAMLNKDKYTDIWNKAKEVVKEKLKDNPEALIALDDYFANSLDKPFADNQLEKAVKKGIKDYEIELSNLVREHYTKIDEVGKSLAHKLIENNVDADIANELSTYIQDKFSQIAKDKKEQILSNTFKTKTKTKTEKKDYEQRIIELSNLGAFSSEKYRGLVAEKLKINVLTSDNAKEIIRLSNAVQEAEKGSRAEKEARSRLIEYMDNLMPIDKWKLIGSYQTIAMLLNTKTASRNFISNLMFNRVTHGKNILATGIDKVVSAKTGRREHILPNTKTQLEGSIEGFKEAGLDFKHNVNTRNINSKSEMPVSRTFGKLKTNNPLLKTFDKGMSVAERLMNLLNDDRPFERGTFKDEIRKLKVLAEMNGEKFDEVKALEKANEKAAYVTFNDENKYSTKMVNLKRSLNELSTGSPYWGAGDILVKFARTPVNIFVRAIDYSPASAFKAVHHAIKTGFDANKQFNQEKFVDDLAKSVTGGLLIGIGILLSKMGAIFLDDDKDKDKAAQDDQTGIKGFQINISAIVRFLETRKPTKLEKGDTLISYDWAVPMATLITLGSQFHQAITEEEKRGVINNVVTFTKALGTGVNGLLEQPFLQGIQKAFNNMSQGEGIIQGIGDVLTSVPQSFIPSALNQVKQLTDNQARETYSKDIVEQTKNSMLNRIPGASTTLPARNDTLGKPREVYQNGSNTFWNVLFNPAITTKYEPRLAEEVTNKLYEELGSKIQYPNLLKKDLDVGITLQKKYRIKNEKITLTDEEYSRYTKWVGQKTEKAIEKYAFILKGNPTEKIYEQVAKNIQSDITEIKSKAKENILILRKQSK